MASKQIQGKRAKMCARLETSGSSIWDSPPDYVRDYVGRLENRAVASDEDTPETLRLKDCVAAACRGDLTTLRLAWCQNQPEDWVLTYQRRYDDEDLYTPDEHLTCQSVCEAAASGGSLDALIWLRGLKPPCPWDPTLVGVAAAHNGHLHVLRWMFTQGPPDDAEPSISQAAAEGGHIRVLKWVAEFPHNWSWYTTSAAAGAGQLETLKWLRSRGCPWDSWACTRAAEHGQIDVLEWARAQDPPCPWDSLACGSAAEEGHFDTLRWLRSQTPPCPWDPALCAEYAKKRSRSDVVAWIETSD